MIPSTIALAAITVSAIVLLRPLVPTWMVHEAGDAPLAAIWLLQAIRAGYRLFGYNYRLTTRRLFHDRGRLYPPDAPLDLATVVRVEVKQSLLGRLIGVGTVRVIPEDAAATVELTGVYRPKVLTAKIEAAATAAREANVTVGHAEASRRASAPGVIDTKSRKSRIPGADALRLARKCSDQEPEHGAAVDRPRIGIRRRRRARRRFRQGQKSVAPPVRTACR